MQAPSPQMNTTPLIDVMLVLLILFIITVPMATHTVNLQLPVQHTGRDVIEDVDIEIDSDGRSYWNGRAVADHMLEQRFRELARSKHIVRVWPDRRVRFQPVISVLAAAQRARVERMSLAPVAE